MNDNSLAHDSLFRRIVVLSTGLGLACMFASLASIRIGGGSGLTFVWHWSILLWMAVGFGLAARFWHLTWIAQVSPSPAAKRRLWRFCGLLLAVGAGAFLYPIRFVMEGYRTDIAKGLLPAVIFLGGVGWFLYRFARGFAEADAASAEKLQ